MIDAQPERSLSTSPSSRELFPSGTRDLLLKLVDVATAAADNHRAEAKDALERAVAMLTNIPGYDRCHNARHALGGLAPWKARRVAAYIQEHIGTSLTAGELATLVQLSHSHFNRAFKVSFEETPMMYVMRQRMRLARELMLTTACPLSQIALQCGLCDQPHFSRMFRRFFGQSPRLWRRQFVGDGQPQRDAASVTH